MTTPPDEPTETPSDALYEAYLKKGAELAVWGEVEPVLGEFESLTELRLYLREAAASRRPDPALTAVGRIAEGDEVPGLAKTIYTESYTAGLRQLARAVSWRDGRNYENAYGLAASTLAVVALEATARDDLHCGKAIMSRTWARTFVVSPPGPRRNRLEAEALAAWARLGASVTAWRDSFAGQRVAARVSGRLAPFGDIFSLVTADDELVADFEARCGELRIPLRRAEKEVAEFVRHRPVLNEVLRVEAGALHEAKLAVYGAIVAAEGT